MGRYGRDNLCRLVSQADTHDIDDDTAIKSKKYLNKCSLDEVRTESTAAAAFHVWVSA